MYVWGWSPFLQRTSRVHNLKLDRVIIPETRVPTFRVLLFQVLNP